MAHRAYGWTHQKRRARLVREHLGLPCPRCGKLMLGPTDPDPRYRDLDLGHSEAWMKSANLPGDRVEHAFCNRSAGNDTRKPYSREWSSADW